MLPSRFCRKGLVRDLVRQYANLPLGAVDASVVAVDAGEARIVLPAAAVAEANRMLRAPWNAWEAVLSPNPDALGAVAVSPSDEHTAVEAGQHGDVATGHVTYEARQIHGVVVTQAGGAYQDSAVSALVI